jgi:hypothetical protein
MRWRSTAASAPFERAGERLEQFQEKVIGFPFGIA